MTRKEFPVTGTVYVNGRYCAPEEATVSIFDRGLLFADAIYEVAAVMDGRLLDFELHMQRLERSLGEMRIPAPMSPDEILAVMRELLARNAVEEGLIYLQITRGSDGDRDFIPSDEPTPTVFMFVQHKSEADRERNQTGIAMCSYPDIRWARRDIKTVGLMGQVFAKSAAKVAGGAEALMVQDGYVTEGGATTFYIVKGDTIVTRPLSNDILPGCTRKAVLALIDANRLQIEERLFTLDEALTADEAFITGASTYVCPVVKLDDSSIGGGDPGPMTRRLQEIYMDFARRDAV